MQIYINKTVDNIYFKHRKIKRAFTQNWKRNPIITQKLKKKSLLL